MPGLEWAFYPAASATRALRQSLGNAERGEGATMVLMPLPRPRLASNAGDPRTIPPIVQHLNVLIAATIGMSASSVHHAIEADAGPAP